MTSRGPGIYEFGAFQLDPVERVLLSHGQVVALTPKGFDLLFALVRNAGRVVNKEQLMTEIWPDTFVEENNLTVTISALRKALGEARSEQRYIQTVPRRGYRFSVSVRQSGGASPLAPYRSSTAEAGSEILVGREPELRKLETWVRQAVEGAGRIIFITGEPGIGKTALSNAFFNRARLCFPAARFCRGRCLEQYGAGEPYLPILEALSELLSGSDGEFVADVLRSRAPTWCLQFPAVFGSDGAMERLYRETVGATKERMLREMVDALGALASAGPVLLHIEDLHWVDHSSINLLGRLGQDAPQHRLLVTGTFRPEDVERANHPFKNFLLEMQTHSQCEEMALGMLSQEHLASYLDSRFAPNRFDPELPAMIHRRTEGQPLFATSLVQFLVERHDIANVNDEWVLTRRLSELDLEAPGNVRKLIRKKIEALDAEDRRALEFASIQGEVFTSAVLAGLLEVDELALEERLDRLDKVHRLIQTTEEDELPDGRLTTRYRFAHVLYQNSLYSDLVNKRRILLHRQAGDLTIRFYGDQAPRLAAQLAVHFERGRDFGRAVEFLVHAGDNARQINANDKAVEHYSRALSLVSRLPVEQQVSGFLTIYQKRGAAYLATSQFDQAVGDFTNLLNHARGASDRRREHSALNSLAEVFFYAHRLDELDDCAGEALRIAEELKDDRLRIETMVFIAMRQDIVGELAEASRNLDEIIRIARDLDDRRALLDGLAWRGQLHFLQSEYESARELLLEAFELASVLRHGPLLLQAQFFLSLTLGNMGRISESLAMLHEVSSRARRNGDRYWQAKVPNSIAWIYRELQDFDRALKIDLEGLEFARTSKVSEAETNSLINLGCDRMHAGELDRAVKSFGDARAILESDVWCRWRFTLRLYEGLSRHHLANEKLDDAVRYARLLLDSATHYGARKYVAVAHKLLADVAIARGDPDDADTELRAALDTLAGCPVPLVAWKVYSALGHLRLRRKDDSSADAFEHASAIVEMIASNVGDETLRATFLAAPAVRDVFVKQSVAGGS
jgi:DNA-binding winged helix-turn-helix (wHTH) protein/tetratricopeptide (TPR) repeat protein